MSKSVRLSTIPVWRRLLVGIGRWLAIYVGVGLILGLLARVIVGPEAWMGFWGGESLMVWVVWWGLGWPWLTFVNISNLANP